MPNASLRSVTDIPMLPGGSRIARSFQLARDPLALMRDMSRGGDLFRIPLFDKDAVAVMSPAGLREVLVEGATSLRKSGVMRYALYPVVGEGLLNSFGDLWRRQRRLMAPIFQAGQIASYAADMVACAERTAAGWRDGETVDLCRETTQIAMNVAGKTLFDAETFSEADAIGAALTVAIRWTGDNVTSFLALGQSALREALERVSGSASPTLGQLARRAADRLHGPVLLYTDEDRKMKEAVALLDDRIQRMIDDRRGRDRKPDLLGRLLDAQDEDGGARMTDRQVRDEALTLFVAGHETTATALAWALYLLTKHPEIQARARAEADALPGAPRHEDLPRLDLLSRVFKETLRLYTPLPLFNRDVVSDLTLAGHRIPVGTTVLICPYGVHHRPDLYPDPERFDPDRFLPEAEAARPRHAFVPFSAGPRICIGNHFALMEGPLVLATLLRRADLEPVTPAEIVPEVHATLRPKGGVPMRIRLRRRH